MKTVVLFGAGKSAGVLIEFLHGQMKKEGISVVVADANAGLLEEKTQRLAGLETAVVDLSDVEARQALVGRADVVISLMPPALHLLLAQDCLALNKHLLTASYVSPEMKALAGEVKQKDLLFLCEMGLDPGIDHMSAMELIDRIKADGGYIEEFHSACGGLVAPESDDNPWHYKISWNPKNVVNAGKDGAAFLEKYEVETQSYQQVFKTNELMEIPDYGMLGTYANRNSLDYIPLYGLSKIKHFRRSTLRHPDFIWGWDILVETKLTDDNIFYDLNNTTVSDFFQEHLRAVKFRDWLDVRLDKLEKAKQILQQLLTIMEKEELAKQQGNTVEDFMTVDESGELRNVSIQESKQNAARKVRKIMHETNVFLRQLEFLGWNNDDTVLPDGRRSAADILQWLMERKMMLQPQDKDWVVMSHEMVVVRDGVDWFYRTVLDRKGKNAQHTAMAETVGLPLGIAAMMLLRGELTLRGLHIPTVPELYKPVLKALADKGIVFQEYTEKM